MVFKQWYHLNFASNAMMMPGKDEFFFAEDVREFESLSLRQLIFLFTYKPCCGVE
jgi:hypothetical protein